MLFWVGTGDRPCQVIEGPGVQLGEERGGDKVGVTGRLSVSKGGADTRPRREVALSKEGSPEVVDRESDSH